MRAFIITSSALFLAVLTLFPSDAVRFAVEGYHVFITSVFPALFPFMVTVGILRRIMKVPTGGTGCWKFLGTFFICSISGAPSGSLMLENSVSIPYRMKSVLSAFLNLSCPAFVMGVAADRMLSLASPLFAMPLIIGHYGSALALAIVYYLISPKKSSDEHQITSINQAERGQQAGPLSLFTVSVFDTMKTMLRICGMIVFFFVVCGMISKSGMLSAFHPAVRAVLFGVIEMTNGISLIGASAVSPALKLTLCSFILSFGGVCIMMQVFSTVKTSAADYFCAKLTHAFLSSAATWLLCPAFLPRDIGVFSAASSSLESIITFGEAALLCLLCSAAASLMAVFVSKRTAV